MVTGLFLLTLFNSFWGIWVFAAAIPLINGLSLLHGFPDVSLAFVGVYLAWLPRQLLAGKSVDSSTTAALFANLLIALVLLNVCLVVARIVDSPVPSRFWIEWFAHFPFVNQQDNVWQMNAALILLKGVFFFRMVELELSSRRSWILFTRTLYVQALFIIAFSLFQFADFTGRGVDYLGLYFPFNDIHSFGSYVVLLLTIFLYYFLQAIAAQKKAAERLPARMEQTKPGEFFRFEVKRLVDFFAGGSLKTVMHGLFVISFLVLCLFSSSRMTWVAMLLILLFFFLAAVKNKKVLICLGSALIIVFIAGSLSVPKLFHSDTYSSADRLNSSLYRLGTLFNVKDYARDHTLRIRYELWGRALKMVEEYPLAGAGVGNFYRNNVHYKNRAMGRWDFENAHNYYLQLAAELGIPAVVLFLALLFSLYYRHMISGRGKADSLSRELSVKPFLYGLAAYLLTMLTGHPLLLSSQQFVFWAIVALIAKGQILEAGSGEMALPENMLFRRAGILLFFLYAVGFSLNVYRHEPRTISSEYGLYSIESWNGTAMRWMAGKAEYYLPKATETLDLRVVAQPFNSQKPDGLTLTVSVNDSVVDTVRFVEGGNKTLRYDVSAVNEKDIKVNLEVDKVFYPRKIGLNNDSRSLGVALHVD